MLVEVEAIDDTGGDGKRIERAAGGDRNAALMPELHIELGGEVVRDVNVCAAAE